MVSSAIGSVPTIAVLVLLPTLLSGTGDKQLAAHYMLVVLVSAIVQVALTSLILYLLLHPLSSVRATCCTTMFVATLIGRGILVGGRDAAVAPLIHAG